jgi:hypothetical protein
VRDAVSFAIACGVPGAGFFGSWQAVHLLTVGPGDGPYALLFARHDACFFPRSTKYPKARGIDRDAQNDDLGEHMSINYRELLVFVAIVTSALVMQIRQDTIDVREAQSALYRREQYSSAPAASNLQHAASGTASRRTEPGAACAARSAAHVERPHYKKGRPRAAFVIFTLL